MFRIFDSKLKDLGRGGRVYYLNLTPKTVDPGPGMGKESMCCRPYKLDSNRLDE